MALSFSVSDAGGDINYPSPFLGGPKGLAPAKIDASAWAASPWVDTAGNLKPGAPGRVASGLVVPISAASQVAQYVCPEATHLGALKADLASAVDIVIGWATGGDLNQDILDELQGTAPSADELAAYVAGGFKVHEGA